MSATSFSPRAIALLLACAVALFALSILLHAYDTSPRATGGKHGPGSYSTSALGSAGLYDTLRRLDRPVSRSVGNALAMTGARGTLILDEPDLNRLDDADRLKLMTAPRLLLILPKWQGIADEGRPAWIAEAKPVSPLVAQQTAALVTAMIKGDSDIIRREWPAGWSVNTLGIKPTGSGIVQLLRSRSLRPLVGTADAMLLGELRKDNTVIWVLSDPDVLANHGFGKGDNAAFMLALIDTLRAGNNTDLTAPIVFDETVHGFRQAEGSPIKLAFRFPFVLVTLLAAVSAGLLLLAGTGRFGAPRPVPPELDFGKAGLLVNSAHLLDYAGHHALMLNRYVRMSLHNAGRSLHAPPGLSDTALAAWLDRIGKARGLSTSCAEIVRTAAALTVHDTRNLDRLFACARDIHRWKGELLHGSASHRHDRSQYPH